MEQTANFGHWLKQRRKALGLTQKALAQQAGCAEVTLRKIEAGDLQPSAALVASLAQAVGVDEADLPGLVSLAHGTGDDFVANARLLRPQRPNNLPAQLTPLIGRSRDITAVRRRLLADGARLVTLLGPPGVGKTRLALAVAGDVLEQFEDGAFFVRLAPVSDPGQVAAAIAQALGVQMSGPNPPELQLRAYLEEKHLLLVLDNFEQIVAAAPLVDDLLRRCPWLHVLVTSRQPLRVRSERQMTIRPLALPVAAPAADRVAAEAMLRYPAVALFADRAEAVLPDFAVDDGNASAVAELCRRLDGLPLAIELVAARVKLLPPKELLARLHGPWLLSTDGLRDVSVRQKTLRGAIGWSYDLLSPAEQTMFAYLSVFVEGFTSAAAEIVAAASSETLGVLVDASLIRRVRLSDNLARYGMHEVIRHYAWELLEALSPVAVVQVRNRHLDFYISLVREVEINPGVPPDERTKRLNILDAEIDNIRSALAWSIERDDFERGLELAARLDWFWHIRRHLVGDMIHQMHQLLASVETSVDAFTRARAFRELTLLAYSQGNDLIAFAACEHALDLWQEVDYKSGIVEALMFLGCDAAHQGDMVAARRHFAELRTVAEIWLSEAYAQGDQLQVASSIHALGELSRVEGDYDAAYGYYTRCLAIDRERGTEWGSANTQLNLARVVFRQGNYHQALAMMHECLVLWQQLDVKSSIVVCLSGIAAVATQMGQLTCAVSLFAAADRLGALYDVRMEYVDHIEHESSVAAARATLSESEFRSAWETGRVMSWTDAVKVALSLIGSLSDTSS